MGRVCFWALSGAALEVQADIGEVKLFTGTRPILEVSRRRSMAWEVCSRDQSSLLVLPLEPVALLARVVSFGVTTAPTGAAMFIALSAATAADFRLECHAGTQLQCSHACPEPTTPMAR